MPLFVLLAPIRFLGDAYAVTQQTVIVDDSLTRVAPLVHAVGVKLHMHSHPSEGSAWPDILWVLFLVPLSGAIALSYCDSVVSGSHLTLLQNVRRGFSRWPSALFVFWTILIILLVSFIFASVLFGVGLGLVMAFAPSQSHVAYVAGVALGVLVLVAAGIIFYVPGFLAFCAVVVDKQPLRKALGFGFKSQFRRGRFLASLGAGLAVALLTAFLDNVATYGGFLAFGLTGWDALDVVVQIVGGVVVSGFFANAALLLYRDYQRREAPATVGGSSVE